MAVFITCGLSPAPPTRHAPRRPAATALLTTRLDSAYWWSNIRQPVRFAAAMETVQREYRPDAVLEIAPHCSLQPTIGQCLEGNVRAPVCLQTLVRDSDARLDFQQTLGSLFRAGVALDFEDLHSANQTIDQLGDFVEWFKIGGQLFTAAGPTSVETFRNLGKKVFLDLKFHDIPNTVAGAVAAAAKTGANMINIHASGGLEMMRAASDAADMQAYTLRIPRPLLLGVTILTSIDEGSFQRDFATERKLRDQVAYLAELSQEAGLDGVVASPLEIDTVRRVCGDRFLIVTPGVRPRWAEAGDQRRITTPSEAIEAGADYIVVGRPITGADNPREAAKNILQEIRDQSAPKLRK